MSQSVQYILSSYIIQRPVKIDEEDSKTTLRCINKAIIYLYGGLYRHGNELTSPDNYSPQLASMETCSIIMTRLEESKSECYPA